MTLLADSISVNYGTRRVLSSARLAAEGGEVAGLLGRMGMGKSTLLKVCAGVLDPDSGWVQFAGEQYSKPRLSTLAARGMFYLAERGNLARAITVRQHFNLIEKRFGKGDRGRAVQLLGIESLLDRDPSTLSGGETRRVEVALAMVRRPACFLADEPFRSVDPKVCESIGEAFRLIAREGCAVVVSGHEVTLLRPFLDKVIWVTSGTTYQLGNTAAAWKHDGFAREYLGNIR